MKQNELAKECFYCKDGSAEVVRFIPLRRTNGYKLIDFEVHLCKDCNTLDDKTLGDYFSI